VVNRRYGNTDRKKQMRMHNRSGNSCNASIVLCAHPTYINSYSLRSWNGTPHTNLLIMKGHLKSLSWTNTTLVPILLSMYTPTQMEPRFNKSTFWVKNITIYCLQKPATKMHSSLIIILFNYLNLCYFTWPQIKEFYCISCLWNNQLNALFSSTRK
jgi:hypothetical protein